MVLKALSAAAIVVLTAGGAFAADPPVRASVEAPVASKGFSWTGCFAGLRAGGAVSDDKIRTSGDFGSAGFIGGGQVGCDYQFGSAWVVGVEGRAGGSSLNSNTSGRILDRTTGVFDPTRFTVSNDFLASVTGRFGYSFVGGWLVYARGGVAWTRENSDIALTPPSLGFAVDPRATMTQTGWTAGAGLDWAFAPHWSTNVEYDYYDFGANDLTMTDTVNGAAVTVSGATLKDRIHTVTVGLNYHF